ncbi:nicalin [Schistocerca americana]|uniref:nicalin n=1 Tax=Schistocerca americana TaxID=7009 RepID=UPI001F4FC113|nr:nicalin [Schistocerca americana]XP_047117271.1 nicalin [Schistocerca piceifrons]XP_049963907.1 nicalin [Schistocerca serialis cubense]
MLEADEILELFRGCLPYYLFIMLPVLIIISPVNPVDAAHEFPVYRMQHFDLHGVPRGSRHAPVNLEARSLTGWSTARQCIVARLEDITPDQFREIRAKAGALLLVLPRQISSLSDEAKQHILELERAMLEQEVPIPVYFIEWTKAIQTVLENLARSYSSDERSISAAEAMLNAVSASGYQVVIASGQASVKGDINIATVQGKLSGYGVEEKLPTIAIVAHYDSFGVAPELSFGADSNGSGVVMLLELARLFSGLYSSPKTHARYNLVFLLSGAGKFNYHGSKKWLEDQLDGVETSIIQEASYVLCLDSVASNSNLYLHVSKPPREGSQGYLFFKELKSVSQMLYPDMSVEGIHKKINLADELLAWEHERYSIRRLPAFTLSSLRSHKEARRHTILDTRDSTDVTHLVQNIQVVAEALARHIYNLSSGEVFSENLGVQVESISSWLDFLSSQPRSAQLLADKQNTLVSTLKDTMSRYLKEVKVSYMTPDKREPEFVFYDITKSQVSIYSVKPAVFDLFLTIAISIYLTVIYFVIQNFPQFYTVVLSIVGATRQKVH